jgi:CD63 antigen
MNLSGGSTCIKYLLFIFNLVFVVTGIVLLIVGAVIQGVYKDYSFLLDDRFFSAPALLIAVGVIVFIVSFFGCCGAVKENHCMILTFSILLLLVFILELSGGIAGYVLRDRAHDFLSHRLNESMFSYNESTESQEFWYTMQTSMECCGNNNYTDWKDVFHNNSLPLSCCPRSHVVVDVDYCNTTSKMYTVGCLEKFGTFVMNHAAVLGGAGIGIAFIQLLGVVLACLLARHIRTNYENV